MFGQDHLPETPPAFSENIALDNKQIDGLQRIVSDLSESLESLPVVLSQDGHINAYAGRVSRGVAEQLAKVTDRTWREGATRIARELLRFAEETIDSEDERGNFLIYSIHIEGAMTLTVGWELTVSLTQIRAEVVDAKQAIQNILIGDSL
ncbi:MAG: hypothetical protein GYB68_15460 [Chloroflexi bacterium]|nr:hypothetical protein [Chloroflexota bacterium]